MAQNGNQRGKMRDRWMDRISAAGGGAESSVQPPERGVEDPELILEDVDPTPLPHHFNTPVGAARRELLTDTKAMDEEEMEDDPTVGGVLGTSTGEEDRDPVPGGWEGTDDATSTAASDIPQEAKEEPDPDEVSGRAYGGGLGEDEGGIVDIKGSPVEGSRDWENDPPIERGRD